MQNTFSLRNVKRYLLYLYIVSIMFSDNTVIFYGCTLLFLGVSAIELVWKKKLYLDLTIALYLGFLLVVLTATVMGVARYPSVSYKRIFVLFINFFVCLSIFEYVKNKENRLELFEFYIKSTFIFELYLFAFSGSNIFRGRLGEYAHSPIAYGNFYNANIVGCTLMFALILDLYFYLYDKKKGRLFRMILFFLGILLTGSRKAIVSTALVCLILPILFSHFSGKKVVMKAIKYIATGSVVLVVILLMLFKIPVLYDIAGQRIEAMVFSVINSGEYTDSSLKWRNNFVELARLLFAESPVLGIGIDNYAVINPIKGAYTHNNYWELLVGSGIVGAVLYYSVYITAIIRIIKKKMHENTEKSLYLVILMLMLMIDYYMVSYLQRLMILFLFICISFAKDRGPNQCR